MDYQGALNKLSEKEEGFNLDPKTFHRFYYQTDHLHIFRLIPKNPTLCNSPDKCRDHQNYPYCSNKKLVFAFTKKN